MFFQIAEIADVKRSLWDSLSVVDKCIGVECAVLRLPECVAMKLIGALLQFEAKRDSAFRSGVCGQTVGGDGYFVNRSDAQRRGVKEAGRRRAVSLKVVVHPIHGDVQRRGP